MTLAERRKRLDELEQRHDPLTPEEIEDLRELFDDIMRAHHHRLRAQLFRRRVRPEDVSDILQDAGLQLFQRLCAGFPRSTRALLFTLTKGLLLNHLRDERKDCVSTGLPSSASAPAVPGPEPERAVDLQDIGIQLLERLSTEERDAFEMCEIEQMSHAEVVEALDIPLGTVKTRVRRAKARLKAWAEKLLPPSQRTAA